MASCIYILDFQLMVPLRQTKDAYEMESWGSKYVTGAGSVVYLIPHPAFSIFSVRVKCDQQFPAPALVPCLPASMLFHTLILLMVFHTTTGKTMYFFIQHLAIPTIVLGTGYRFHGSLITRVCLVVGEFGMKNGRLCILRVRTQSA